MASIFAGIILIFVSTFRIVLGELKDPLTWEAAQNQCAANKQIVAPMALLNEDIYSPRQSVWSSNFILNLGCIPDTDLCSGLLVEKAVDSNIYDGLCYEDQPTKIKVYKNSKFKSTCGGNKTSLIKINNMLTLTAAKESMNHETKYWIGSFNINAQDSFVRLCQVFHKITSKSFPVNTNSNCDDSHRFWCVSDAGYQTVISITRLSTTDTTTIKDLVQHHQNVFQSGTTVLHVTGILFIVALPCGLLIIGVLTD